MAPVIVKGTKTKSEEPHTVEAKAGQTIAVSEFTDSVVQITGACDSVTVDDCSGAGIVFDDLSGSLSITNSKKLQVQCTAVVKRVDLEGVSGCTLFLSEAGKNEVKIYTRKCTEINVVVLGEDDEHAIPTQFKSKYSNGKLLTGAGEHIGV